MGDPSNGLRVTMEEVHKDYLLEGRQISVFEGTSWELPAGSTAAVLGKSGSGKSTLLQLLGLLDRPSAGRITYDGEEVLGRRDAIVEEFRNRQIGFVFQFHHLLPEFTAAENVMMPAVIAGRSMPEARDQALALLERVGLADRSKHAPGEMSGGEQQRVALARALLREPDLLVLDEPMSGVDVTGQADLYALIARIRHDRRCGVLLVSHDLHLVMSETDIVICLNRHVCCRGRPESVARDPAYMALFGATAAAQFAVYAHGHDHVHGAGDEIIPVVPRADAGGAR